MRIEEAFGTLAKIRAAMPLPVRAARPSEDRRMDAWSIEEFEGEALADAIEALADDVRAMVEEMRRRTFEKALDVYYTTEELARDPANANLIEHVENMRRAYESQYGCPIPTKEETARRRAAASPI